MSTKEPVIKRVSIGAAAERLPALVKGVRHQATRVLVEEGGTPVAALVSPEDLDRLSRLDRERADRFRVLDEARAAFHDATSEEIDREADRAVAELRSGATESR